MIASDLGVELNIIEILWPDQIPALLDRKVDLLPKHTLLPQRDPQHSHRIIEMRRRRVDNNSRFAGQEPQRAGIDSGHGRWQPTVNLKRPHILKCAAARQLGGVILSIVEEPFLASDRAERGIGYGESPESRRCDL